MTIRPYQKPRITTLDNGWNICFGERRGAIGASPEAAFGFWLALTFGLPGPASNTKASALVKSAHIFRENGELKIAI